MTLDERRPSQAFASGIERTHPKVGPAWLRELARLERRLAQMWGLDLAEWLLARGSYVTRASTRDGEQVVMKIPVVASDTVSERAVLGYWGGEGAPRLLRVDAPSGALLMEWIDGHPFADQPDTERSLRRAGRFLRDLHRPRPARRPDLPTLEEKLAPLRRSRERAERSSASDGALDEATLLREAAVLAWLAQAPDSVTRVIHGDLHPRNLLAGPDGALAAIDPYGVIGDPARDAASLGLFFREDGETAARLEALAQLAALDAARVVAHAYALAVGAYRFRVAYGIATGRDFLAATIGELERRLPDVGP